MDVFSAFPNAITTRFEIGSLVRQTRLGKRFERVSGLKAIADEGAQSTTMDSTNPQGLQTDTLLYVCPKCLPTLSSASLVGDYLIHDTCSDQYYEITSVGVGKNQETGQVEHMELFVKPTGVLNEG